MNCKTVNKSKFKLMNYFTSKNNDYNKASKNVTSIYKYIIVLWQAIFHGIDNNHNNYKRNYNYCDTSYNVTDRIELRLIASKKTFL